jgi:hypothetical protein
MPGKITECVVTNSTEEPAVQFSIAPSVAEIQSNVLSAKVPSSELPWLEVVSGHQRDSRVNKSSNTVNRRTLTNAHSVYQT